MSAGLVERLGLKKFLPQIKDGPLMLQMGGRRILVHHFIDWCSSQDIAEADIIISGHTHEAVNEQENGTLFLNPGECCGWVYDRCTVALLDTEMMAAEIIDLITASCKYGPVSREAIFVCLGA